MNSLIFIVVLFICGGALRKTGLFSKQAPIQFNLYVIYVALPALILKTLPSISINESMLKVVAIAWMAILLSVIAVLFISKKLGLSREITGVLLLLVPFGNTSFVGIPLISALVGEKGLPTVIIYDQLGSFLGMILYGSWVLAVYSGAEKPSIQILLKRMLLFPPFWALVLALSFPMFWQMDVIQAPISTLSNTLIPIVMIALGLQFEWRLPYKYFNAFISGLILKLIIIPASLLSIINFLDWQGLSIKVSLLESAMAPMISAGALAIASNLAPELVAAMLSWGLIISFITVPLWYQFIF